MRLFPVKTGQLLINPDGSKRKESGDQGKDAVFIIPCKYLSYSRQEYEVQGKK